jgi:hypothetical protein
MAISPYQREQERIAGPKFTRALLTLFAVGALVGLGIGIIWVIAGLLHFHPLW